MRSAVLLLAALLLTARAYAADDPAVEAAADALHSWDVVAAGKALSEVEASEQSPVTNFLRGRLAFQRGLYDDAVTLLEAALAAVPDDKGLNSALGLYTRTRDLTRDYKKVTTRGGHFVIAYQPGVDEVLIPYADLALERAYRELGAIFRFRPEEPVRVEIYPRVENLADVSPLKASEIRASGTIALCKYNRLMIVSPRALVYGYEWLDTLAHEYIHLLVTRRSRNKVPIWLHEGMAKFYENRWREEKNARLARFSEDLLAKAVRDKKLIRFEAMSPSMAKLPTQEDASLAFAEVFTVMEMFHVTRGADGVNILLDAMRDGASDQEAVARVAQKSFRRFQREWRNYLYQKNLRKMPVHASHTLLFRDRTRPKDELKDIPEEQARKLAYLGDRLAVKKRYKAAAKEYAKSLKRAGGPNPIISAKLASALLRQGRHREVEAVVTPALELNASHVLLYLYRGTARLAVGEYAAARDDLERAIEINPFDPEVHGQLARALSKLGLTDEAAREARHQKLVAAH